MSIVCTAPEVEGLLVVSSSVGDMRLERGLRHNSLVSEAHVEVMDPETSRRYDTGRAKLLEGGGARASLNAEDRV